MTRWLLLILFGIAMAFAACGGDDTASTTPTSQAAKQYAGQGITVFAASSLTDAFNEIGGKFTDETGAPVTFNFGGSSDLRAQLVQGAPADVFASADMGQMGLAKDAGVVADTGTIFVRNRLVVIVPKGNSAGITTLQDLANPGIKISLADETVPVGKYARQFLDNANADVDFVGGYKDKVLANVVTNASNVKEVATAVQLDEVDAGIVYTTDVSTAIAGDVKTIEITDGLNVIATYPINVTTQTTQANAAQAFVDFVLGRDGQAILIARGFLKPQ